MRDEDATGHSSWHSWDVPRTRLTARLRRTSKRVATSPGCKPLREMYAAAVLAKPKSWNAVEAPYLRAMEAFDDNIVSGVAKMADLQNGKGDFFNDLLALILENCAEVGLFSRGGVPGFIMPTHNLDITHPDEGIAKFLVEAKALGTPKHSGSEEEGPMGREGSADIKKRVSELAFKTIDLKVEHGRIEAQHGGSPAVNPGGSLTTWLRGASPKTYLFIAARVISDTDRDAVIAYGERAAQVEDGVGIFCYRPRSESTPTRYNAVGGIPESLQLERTLHRACLDLSVIKSETPIPLPQEVIAEAARAEDLRQAAGEQAEG